MTTGFVRKINGLVVSEEEWQAASKPGRLEEMLRERRPPSANTDREFMLGQCNGSQFEGREAEGDRLKAQAEAAGQDVKGKVYMPGLARFPGDPEAWVAGKGDAEQLLDARGWGAQGAINRPVRRVAEAARVAVDPALVEAEVAQIAAELAPGQPVDKVDLAEQVFNRRKGANESEVFEPGKHCPGFCAESESPCPAPA